MKHKELKFLSLLLTLVMMLSLVPAAAAVSGMDIDDLMGKMLDLAYEKADAGEYAAYYELKEARKTLRDAYFEADNEVTPAVETAYNKAMAVYLQYTATVNVDGVSIDPGSFRTLTVGERVTVKAEVYPDNATNKNVIWSVNGTGVTLYEDQACTTTVILEHSTSLLTVYARPRKLAGAR